MLQKQALTLEWLATGHGPKFNDEELDILRIPRSKIVDGQLYDSGTLCLIKSLSYVQITTTTAVMRFDGLVQYIVDQSYSEVYDDDWLKLKEEGKLASRTLTRFQYAS